MKKNIILIVFALLLLGGCKKDKEVQVVNIVEKNPTVTASVTSVTIREKYGYPSDLKSVTVAYTKNSDYSSASMIPAEIQVDPNNSYYHYYYVKLTNLEPNTKYYYHCIFDTGYGSAEGKQRSFTTQATVTTAQVSDITQTTATCGGNVTSNGSVAVTARGVCWSTSQNPTVSNSHTTDGSGTGNFTSSITGLTENTTYYVRAYATNSAGTSYGEQKNFTTQTTPTVTTSSVSNITQTTATCGGNVTSDGGATVTARGVCWSTSPNPTVSDSHTTNGSGTGSFTSSITGLTANTTYYVRAYATNSAGTSYGEQKSFTTLQSISVPTVTTSSVSNISQTTATCGGNVTSDGGAAVTARGVCWSTSQNPTVSDSHTTDGSGTGSFTSSITGLTANRTYYVRAYATNSAGTSYGEQRTFTTQGGGGTQTTPTVTTSSVSNITQTTATCGGNVTSDGGAAVTARGVCWSTSQNPTVSNSHTTDGSGTGSFTSSITGLTANTTYYVRAYATNSAGTSYGEQRTFTTQGGGGTQTTPTVTTSSVSNITQTTATCGGNVTSDGGAAVTARGVCWSTSQNPTVSNSHTTDGSGTGSFTSSITGLTASTTYYVRAYATNSAGTSYGEQRSFTTPQNITSPTVTTNNVTDIIQTTATCGGNVTSDGGAAVSVRGVCWSTSQNPTVNNNHTTDGGGTGSFTSSITGLTASTTYYVRAYATNSAGTSYGEQKSFTTLQSISVPTVTTSQVSNITQTTATCGGSVTSDGGATVTARGVCWSTSQNPTVSDSHTTDGSGTGSFTSNITGLTENTTYYVRAYATNSAGTSYGEQESFTTLQSISVPTVTTSSVSNISQTTATCGGNVTSDGGAAVTARGVCWSTSSNPTVSDSHTTDGSGTGSFTSSITGLTANRTYYVRAYATNSAGTSYGEQKSFTTHGTIAGHEYVDLGLPSGLLWATCNVGADSPEGYGWYFMWGSTTSGGDSNCSGANCPGNGGNPAWDATHLTNNVLNPEVDAASVNWGSDWRMPTTAEWQELYDNTTCTWTTENGVYGRKFEDDNGNYVFLPAAGYRLGSVVINAGHYGFYWSGSLYSSSHAYCMLFSGNVTPQGYDYRYFGLTVRPVRVAR